ncbi:hypothetical protein ACGC1H_001007 [Rhizoctonia solani]|uniref:Uncharacterized protein n=1 Tax=Rhizoctonia solani TaxID=456999 RepID=A0A8H3GXE3_9AGAM|nr:unnamed protein product [Rhizoctonia solani]
MPCHAQSLTCHLLSYFAQIGKEECESVEVILGLIPLFNSNTGINVVAPKTRSFCRRLLPQLTELATHHNSRYTVQKPYHMINLTTMLTTIVRPLVYQQSSYERSELHSTIDAAHNFLRSDLANIRAVVSKWIQAHPSGFFEDSRHHIGSWEYSIKPVARPTARIIIPPNNPPPRVYVRTHQFRRSASFTRRRATQTASTYSQESKIADILEALELVEPQTSRARSDSESSSDSSCITTPNNDDLDTHFDYVTLKRKPSLIL